MLSYLPILIPLFIITLVIIFIALSYGKSQQKAKGTEQSSDRKTIIKEANKRLSNNPKDSQALLSLANLHYSEANFTQAMKTYGILLELCATNPRLDEQEINKKFGLSAFYAQIWKEAYKSILLARSKAPQDFELNYALGELEYRKGNYGKAVNLLKICLKENDHHFNSIKYIGLALYKLNRFNESRPFLRNAASGHPDDKEILFALGHALYEQNQLEQALKIFTHLRPDPLWGPQSALFCGKINKEKGDFSQAIIDLGIGLKHEGIEPTIQSELKYLLGLIYNQAGNIDNALAEFNDLYNLNPKYKDVALLRQKTKELTGNKNLKIYLLSPISEFITLCRRIVIIIFPKTRIKIIDISVRQNESVDILAEIKAKKWEDTILFRFYRGEGQVGELAVRELYAHIKEVHAGRGFCLSAGLFSEEANHFVEARLIDLIPKEKLKNILNKLKTSL